MQKGQTHPAALVSKSLISDALISLIQESGFLQITITLLCERAQIARRTFYRNFDTVEDVLRYIGSQTIEEFVCDMLRHKGESYPDLLASFFSFWREHNDRFTLFANNDLTHILFEGYIGCLSQLSFLFGSASDSAYPANGYLQAYVAGGLWSVLMYQNAIGKPVSSQELAHIISCNEHAC